MMRLPIFAMFPLIFTPAARAVPRSMEQHHQLLNSGPFRTFASVYDWGLVSVCREESGSCTPALTGF